MQVELWGTSLYLGISHRAQFDNLKASNEVKIRIASQHLGPPHGHHPCAMMSPYSETWFRFCLQVVSVADIVAEYHFYKMEAWNARDTSVLTRWKKWPRALLTLWPLVFSSNFKSLTSKEKFNKENKKLDKKSSLRGCPCVKNCH